MQLNMYKNIQDTMCRMFILSGSELCFVRYSADLSKDAGSLVSYCNTSGFFRTCSKLLFSSTVQGWTGLVQQSVCCWGCTDVFVSLLTFLRFEVHLTQPKSNLSASQVAEFYFCGIRWLEKNTNIPI